jgi:hypothetical protein
MSTDPCNSTARIVVTIDHSPLAFVYGLFTPTVTVNGRAERRKWGTHTFVVPPGSCEVAISYPWFLSRECGRNSVRFDLVPGEEKKVRYCAGLVRYVPGTITVSR